MSAGRASDLHVLSPAELHSFVLLLMSAVDASGRSGMQCVMAQALEDTLALVREAQREEILMVVRSIAALPIETHHESTEAQSANESSLVIDRESVSDQTAALKMMYHLMESSDKDRVMLADIKRNYINALENCIKTMQEAVQAQQTLLDDNILGDWAGHRDVIISEKTCQAAIKRVELARGLADGSWKPLQ